MAEAQTRGGPSALQRQLAQRKQNRAVQLRALGFTLDQIASSLLPCPDHRPEGRQDCPACLPMYRDRSGAKRALDRALAAEYGAGAATREELRRRQLAQTDLLLQRAMRLAVGAEPDMEAARVALRALERQARLLGLDAPTRITVDTELDQQIRELGAALAEQVQGPAVLS